MSAEKTVLTVEAVVNAPINKVWQYWTEPRHIMQWNSASEDWTSPSAENDVREGGTFSFRMEAKDGSMGFDFGGVYDKVDHHREIAYTMGDGRKAQVLFAAEGNVVKITEHFEAEGTNPPEMQQGGWQAIMNNFKKYTENN